MNNYGRRPQYDKIPVPYVKLVPYLIHVGAIVRKETPPIIPPYHLKHNHNSSCVFHAGYIGNSTEDC